MSAAAGAGVAAKVTGSHLTRTAYLYVRQSTLRQVVEHTESGQRQYALRQRAIALGWPAGQIVVIDTDQGQSGASAADREGFKRLVAEVGMGSAGIVLGLEVSRLARNNADWHRLLEICAMSDTLICDEDGLYDPGDFNDRLLLGLKGTMSEAELHFIRARLRGGQLSKARRGELQIRLPVGLEYDPAGNVALDPDSGVQRALRHLFDTFHAPARPARSSRRLPATGCCSQPACTLASARASWSGDRCATRGCGKYCTTPGMPARLCMAATATASAPTARPPPRPSRASSGTP